MIILTKSFCEFAAAGVMLRRQQSPRLTPGYAPCRLTACDCHNVTALHYVGADTDAFDASLLYNAIIRDDFVSGVVVLVPHPQGDGACASHLTLGCNSCRLAVCGCHNVTALHGAEKKAYSLRHHSLEETTSQ